MVNLNCSIYLESARSNWYIYEGVLTSDTIDELSIFMQLRFMGNKEMISSAVNAVKGTSCNTSNKIFIEERGRLLLLQSYGWIGEQEFFEEKLFRT